VCIFELQKYILPFNKLVSTSYMSLQAGFSDSDVERRFELEQRSRTWVPLSHQHLPLRKNLFHLIEPWNTLLNFD